MAQIRQPRIYASSSDIHAGTTRTRASSRSKSHKTHLSSSQGSSWKIIVLVPTHSASKELCFTSQANA